MKLSYILRNGKPEKNPYISAKRNSKNTFYLSGSNILS